MYVDLHVSMVPHSTTPIVTAYYNARDKGVGDEAGARRERARRVVAQRVCQVQRVLHACRVTHNRDANSHTTPHITPHTDTDTCTHVRTHMHTHACTPRNRPSAHVKTALSLTLMYGVPRSAVSAELDRLTPDARLNCHRTCTSPRAGRVGHAGCNVIEG